MASGRRVRRVFEAVFISSDTRVGFGRHRQISTQPDASSPHLTPPQASTFMGWRRVVGFVMFSGYFFKFSHDFLGVAGHTSLSARPIDRPVDIHDASAHIGWHRSYGGAALCNPPVIDRTPPHITIQT